MVETRSMKRKPRLSPNLPTDLCRDIFSRLPVKSLLRFRSVSKTWRSIIHDPEFVKSRKYSHPGSEIYLLRSVDDRIESVVRCSETFAANGEQETVRVQEFFPGENTLNERKVSLIGCEDGLFLFESPKTRLVLWNPFIRRFRMLPQTPPEVEGQTSLDVGLGFDPSIEDYKHVRLVLRDSLVLVYTLGTNSWKTIPFKSRDNNPPWFFYPFEVGKSVCFRGSLYLLTYRPPSTMKMQRMVSFDLDTEEFSSADLPEVDDDFRYYERWLWSLKCASDGSSLALVRLRENQGTIWWAHGEGGDVTWSKRYVFGSKMSIRNVLNIDVGDGGGVEEAVLLLNLEAGVALYNVEDGKEKIVVDERKSGSLAINKAFVRACTYVESLGLLN